MSILERVYRIERMLKQNRAVPMKQLVEELEASRATIKRDLDYLRDRLNAPVIWDRRLRGYRLDTTHVLPALYLSPTEIQSLLVLQQLIARVHPAVARHELAAMRAVFLKLVAGGSYAEEELDHRIRIL